MEQFLVNISCFLFDVGTLIFSFIYENWAILFLLGWKHIREFFKNFTKFLIAMPTIANEMQKILKSHDERITALECTVNRGSQT